MNNIKAHGKRILTLVAESELIQHSEQFRDSRRGNQQLRKRMRWLRDLNNHNNSSIVFSVPELNNKLTVNILHS